MDPVADLGRPFADSSVAAECFHGETAANNSRVSAQAKGVEVRVGNQGEVLGVVLYLRAMDGFAIYGGDIPCAVTPTMPRRLARKRLGRPEAKSGEENDFQWDTFYVDGIALTLNYTGDEGGVESVEVSRQT
jgi:hypothetical protein